MSCACAPRIAIVAIALLPLAAAAQDLAREAIDVGATSIETPPPPGTVQVLTIDTRDTGVDLGLHAAMPATARSDSSVMPPRIDADRRAFADAGAGARPASATGTATATGAAQLQPAASIEQPIETAPPQSPDALTAAAAAQASRASGGREVAGRIRMRDGSPDAARAD